MNNLKNVLCSPFLAARFFVRNEILAIVKAIEDERKRAKNRISNIFYLDYQTTYTHNSKKISNFDSYISILDLTYSKNVFFTVLRLFSYHLQSCYSELNSTSFFIEEKNTDPASKYISVSLLKDIVGNSALVVDDIYKIADEIIYHDMRTRPKYSGGMLFIPLSEFQLEMDALFWDKLIIRIEIFFKDFENVVENLKAHSMH